MTLDDINFVEIKTPENLSKEKGRFEHWWLWLQTPYAFGARVLVETPERGILLAVVCEPEERSRALIGYQMVFVDFISDKFPGIRFVSDEARWRHLFEVHPEPESDLEAALAWRKAGGRRPWD